MGASFRILSPLGSCSIGDRLGVEIDGRVIEGRITFLSRTPTGGWLVALDADGDTYEVYCSRGTCSIVSHVTDSPRATRLVADSRTGRRLTSLHW